MCAARARAEDRKSTRLNSSHLGISYAVCRSRHSFPTRRSSDLVRKRGGRMAPPTPAGVPVVTTSPGSSVKAVERCSTWAKQSKISCRVFECWRSSPSTHVRSSSACGRSEEHTSELQSLRHLVCRLPVSTLFPYTTLFRSGQKARRSHGAADAGGGSCRHHVTRFEREGSREMLDLGEAVEDQLPRVRVLAQLAVDPCAQLERVRKIGRAHV